MSDHDCIHEDQLQNHSRLIERLETRADYKEKMIDTLNENMEKMNEKLDAIVTTVNEIKMESNRDDTSLELRLTKIEAELSLQKELNKKKLTLYGLGLTVFTIVINLLPYLLR
jgi:uncharacterized coiled-coil protein SlyX